MALRIGRPTRKLSWPELRARVLDAVGPGVGASAAADDAAPPWVAWHEGPAVSTVLDAVGATPGWEWAAVAPALEPALPPEGPAGVLWVRRSYSLRALATALVRAQASTGRPFAVDDARARDAFSRSVDVDDPARSGFPLVDGIVDLLLERDDPAPVPSSGSVVDDLAGKLARLGYDALWAVAYRDAP